MTKPSALPLWQGLIPQSLGVGKLLKQLKNKSAIKREIWTSNHDAA